MASCYPRKDGSWDVYLVQSCYKRDPKNGWAVYAWVAGFDNRERVESMGLVYEETTLQPSGRVWQESGTHGTTNLEYARVLLRLCRKDQPRHDHRIVRMTVSRQTEVVE